MIAPTMPTTISQKSKTVALDEQAGEPARNSANHQPNDEIDYHDDPSALHRRRSGVSQFPLGIIE